MSLTVSVGVGDAFCIGSACLKNCRHFACQGPMWVCCCRKCGCREIFCVWGKNWKDLVGINACWNRYCLSDGDCSCLWGSRLLVGRACNRGTNEPNSIIVVALVSLVNI